MDFPQLGHSVLEFMASQATSVWEALSLESMNQGQQVAAGLTTVAVDSIGGIQLHSELAILAFRASVVEHTVHAMLFDLIFRLRQSVVL